MIADVDDVLRKMLIREIDIKGNEVDIAFDQPKREWSSRLSKPTINLFLFDIRENLRLRGAEQYSKTTRDDGIVEVRRNPTRMDLRYIMTAWVKEAEDEHLLLSTALMGLLRNPFIPADLLPERLQDQPSSIPLEVATFPPEAGPIDKFSEIWGVLDNEMRPGIILTVTVSMDPYSPALFPPVKTRQTRFVQSSGEDKLEFSKAMITKPESHTYWSIGGKVKSEKYDPSSLTIILTEKNQPVEINEAGQFVVDKVLEGEYHLDVLYNKKVLKRQKIHVPGPDYEILV
ncbi:MAG: DUF4255 domain-containing protein [Anaerolineae bacterium]|nr:DUF4255 domain-containing protein [Anaerolineae bacterium]